MSTVDITGVEPGFFITVALFILFILSMLGMGVLSFFQLKKRPGLLYVSAGAVGIVAFIVVLNALYL